MPQKNPTKTAQSQVLNPARPHKAGRGILLLNDPSHPGLEREIQRRFEALEILWNEQTSCMTEMQHKKRIQLSEEIKISLANEIQMMQEMTRSFVRAAKSGGEEDYPVNLAKTLYLLGLSCGKVALLMRTHVELTGNQSAMLSQQLLEALTAFNQEVEEVYGHPDPDQT